MVHMHVFVMVIINKIKNLILLNKNWSEDPLYSGNINRSLVDLGI